CAGARRSRKPADHAQALLASARRSRDRSRDALRSGDRENGRNGRKRQRMISSSGTTRAQDAKSVAAFGNRKSAVSSAFLSGRYWARTSDLQLVELALSQLS